MTVVCLYIHIVMHPKVANNRRTRNSRMMMIMILECITWSIVIGTLYLVSLLLLSVFMSLLSAV